LILGVYRDHFPRITLTLPGSSGALAVEFILDTDFDGDLALPSSILRQLDVRPLFLSLRALGDGTLLECPVYQLEIDWNEEARTVEIIALEHNPLLGTTLMEGCQLDIDMSDGGEVVIEFQG
jgi:clan AA aspartic protease